KDPMSSRMNDAVNKLNVEGSRGSFGFGSKPPPSPGAKRNSGLDPNTIKSMFPDAANAIEDQKAEFQKSTGTAPKSNRNSMADRLSFAAPTISGPEEETSQTENQPPIGRPKSSSGQQAGAQPPMGQFGVSQPLPSASLRSPRPFPLSGDSNIQNTTVSAADGNPTAMPLFSPYAQGGSWASAMNTPMVPNFNTQQSVNQADMVANATAMKLAALSTVNNRIQLDDVRKYRRARSSEGQGGMQPPMSAGLPSNILMTNEYGQVLSPQQAAALQQQQIAAMQGRRSRPSSPGIAITGPGGGMAGVGMPMAQTNGFLSTFDGGMGALNNGLAGMNMANMGTAYGMGSMGSMGSGEAGYLSDASEIARGRSPRGRRGSSKPPEDPTDLHLLKDVPNWLRSLRLHKYTDNLKDMRWQDLVALDEEGLEKRGVAAKGARSKLLKVFEEMLRNTITLMALSAAFFSTSLAAPTAASAPLPTFSLVADYSGSSFFDGFTTFTGTDPTNGIVAYVSMQEAAAKHYVGFIDNRVTNSTNAYIGVDYTSVTANRESVRLSSKATYDVGTIIAMDVVHVPAAYGSWPALWLLGDIPGGTWPTTNGGEIDIFEVVHTSCTNAMTMHTGPCCSVDNATATFQGQLQNDNRNAGDTTPGTTGCSVQAVDQAQTRGMTLATAGEAFNQQNGGVYVTVWMKSGVSVYLFDRSALPADLMAGSPTPTTWKIAPLAYFSGTGCDYATVLSTMRITTDQTFCGDWAGKPAVWKSSGAEAATGTATCAEYVQNNPGAFKDAYFEIAGIKVFSRNWKMPAVTTAE
ncbi:hypothetical protein B0A55_12056, partial [Friedmanniomyces simplex]